MKILVVSKCPTHPTTAGNRNLILAYTNMLQEMGHDVHFLFIPSLPLGDKDKREEAIGSRDETARYWGDRYHEYRQTSLENLWSSCLVYHVRRFGKGYWHVDDDYPTGLGKFTRHLNNEHNFDAIIVNYVYLSKLLTKVDIKKKAIFTHDYFTFKDLHTGIRKCSKSLSADSEAKGLQRAEYIFAMQDEEAAIFRALSPKSKVLINYSIFTHTPQAVVGNHNILFLSGPNIFNINGLNWFLDDIFPLITKKFPDATLLIGGAICSALKDKRLPDNVKLLGFVDNPSDFYALGDVAINPTYQGTGLKIKTFESIAFDKVTLVHPHSTTGIFDKANAPLMSSNNPADWVGLLEDLWSDIRKISDIKQRNLQYIERTNEFISGQFNEFLET